MVCEKYAQIVIGPGTTAAQLTMRPGRIRGRHENGVVKFVMPTPEQDGEPNDSDQGEDCVTMQSVDVRAY